jgi:hypothetical protein
MTYEQLIRQFIANALVRGPALEALVDPNGADTLETRIAHIDLIQGVVLESLNSGRPYASLEKTLAVANPLGRTLREVDVFKPVIPIQWTVGYWLENGLIASDEAAMRHLSNIGLNDDGLFYQLRS